MADWKEKYQNAKSGYSEQLNELKKDKDQYDGNLKPEKGKDVTCLYNFTKELLESEIDVNVPPPKVEPKIPNDRSLKLASIIEDMLKGEVKNLKLDLFNDTDDRNAKIYGGNVALVDWNNLIKTHDTIGSVDIKSIIPTQFIPQDKITEPSKMDYLFIDFNISKRSIKKLYGKDLTASTTEDGTNANDDVVTQHYCFYRSDNGIGCYSWVDDTVLIDEENYNARQIKECSKCGVTYKGNKTCECGSTKWKKRTLPYEELTEDITTNMLDDQGNPIIIPAQSYAREDNGQYKYQDVEVPQTEVDPLTGQPVPLYERVFDEQQNIIGEKPMTTTEPQAYMEPTKLPYYMPSGFPVIVRKNVSSVGKVLGDSDCSFIRNLQLENDKLSTTMLEKLAGQGDILTKPEELEFSFSNGRQIINLTNQSQKGMIDVKSITFDISQNLNAMTQMYMWAKSALGINDSAQGKQDTTATSGRAKQAQISRALGRQESKVRMKNAYYAEIYRKIFEYMLAYADEPRTYQSETDDGEKTEAIFSRYDFYEQDDKGKWFINDQFIFTTDSSGSANEDRQTLLDQMSADFGAGLYGNPQDPETMVSYWKDREALNYPNAKKNRARWEKKAEEQRQMQEQMQAQQMQQQQLIQQNVGGVSNDVQQMPIMQG